MQLTALEVSGYRSIKQLAIEVGQLTVVVGANGTGKTNLYRALTLACAAADGGLARALAEEGGMPSALWAGERPKGAPARMRVALTMAPLRYAISCGLVPPPAGVFALDPDVKEERIELLDENSPRSRPVELLLREGGSAHLRDEEGARVTYPFALSSWESVLSQITDPRRYPVVHQVRQALRSVRFYHQFRTDGDSPLRQPQVGVRTPVLAHDGCDLAAALATIREIGDAAALDERIADAFPGSRLGLDIDERTRFAVTLSQPGLRRALAATELSDGTLRYLCLVAALLSPRPPLLLALNEPETSLHPDLLAPLARLLRDAADRTQVWVTTHARPLADALAADPRARLITLDKKNGETRATV